jgi:ribosomal protein S12 methylthiotransferase
MKAKVPVNFTSLGCPKNLVDSEVMLGLLGGDGRFEIISETEKAEVIIINTCSFVNEARMESVDTILELAELKKTSNCRVLVVTGCLTQLYKDELARELPEVDLFLGTGEYHRIVELLDKLDSGELTGKVYVDTPTFIHSEKDLRQITGENFSAYLKIAEGCDRGCSFCIIPNLRGRQRSRTIESLVDEAKKLASNGAKELNIISQDTIRYGTDIIQALKNPDGSKAQMRTEESLKTDFENTNLENLLRELVKVDGIEWIRLFYIYPDDLSDELIQIIRDEPKICKYLDLPVQHFDDSVLKLMNRRVTGEKIIERVKKLKDEIPAIVIRSSVIVGHPGENEKAFENLKAGLNECDFDHLGVFKFSPEEGTRSEKFVLENETLEEDKKYPLADTKELQNRYREIYKLQQDLVTSRNESFLGKEIDVLVEGVSDETDLLLQGRHMGQAPEIDSKVLINDGEALPGQIYKVKITETAGMDLVGGISLS